MPIGLCIAYGCFRGIKPSRADPTVTVWPAKLKIFYCLVFYRKTMSTPIVAKFHEERVLILFVLRILCSKQKDYVC